jgi:hypothetical protein
MSSDDPVPRNRTSGGGQSGADAVPQPLRHFADRLLFDRVEYDPERGTWRALASGDPGRDNR